MLKPLPLCERRCKLVTVDKRRVQDPFRVEIRKDRVDAVCQLLGALLAVAAIVLLFVGAGLLATRSVNEPASPTLGHVVRFGSYATDLGDRPMIVVKLQDGTIRQLHVRRAQLQTCRKGDPIQLIEQGHMIFVHARACRRQQV